MTQPTTALTPEQERLFAMRTALRRYVQRGKARQALTPEVVTAYAALHMTTDTGRPIAPAPHHRVWLELMCNEAIQKLLIIASPESAKTTWVAAYVGCYIGFWPERSVIFSSATGPIAEARSISLRHTVLSAPWRATFPDVRPAQGLPWKTHRWSLAPGGQPHPGRIHPTIAAYGTGGSVVGSRADLIVGDDILDPNNSATTYLREQVSGWLHSTLFSRAKSKTGRILMIGTRWTHDDAYQELIDAGDWVVCHMPLMAETPDGLRATITYPDAWTGPTLGEPLHAADGGRPAPGVVD